jgi:hypothetical protein
VLPAVQKLVTGFLNSMHLKLFDLDVVSARMSVRLLTVFKSNGDACTAFTYLIHMHFMTA